MVLVIPPLGRGDPLGENIWVKSWRLTIAKTAPLWDQAPRSHLGDYPTPFQLPSANLDPVLNAHSDLLLPVFTQNPHSDQHHLLQLADLPILHCFSSSKRTHFDQLHLPVDSLEYAFG